MEHIRTLGWNQPYGTLMLPPYNKIETRSRQTHVRGKVLIYTTLKPMAADRFAAVTDQPLLRSEINHLVAGDPTRHLHGYAIGVGNLVYCRPMQKADAAKTWTRFDPKLWCWVFEDVRRIQPFKFEGYCPVKRKVVSLGGQGWGTLQEREQRLIQYLLPFKH